MKKLSVVLIKPSKYRMDGWVERFRRGFMPNATLLHIASMTPQEVAGYPTEVHAVDEYVCRDLDYLQLLQEKPTLVALVGVQSHQFPRALDLAAYARQHGTQCVIGGPHPITCDTSALQGRGVSFALAEAELIWHQILVDATRGELQPVYGADQRWAKTLEAPVINPPSRKALRRYVIPMLGIYPARGCPYTCNFCSVIKIAGRKVRSQSIETTIKSLKRAQAAGVRMIMFTSDNFNKYAEVKDLLQTMIAERLQLKLKFFCQCDTQIVRQPKLVELLGQAGCYQMFVGVESFSRKTLLSAKKAQNHPEQYQEIIRLCQQHGITTHFSNIIGFPDDTEESILEHLRRLGELNPTDASFYILCPIPGTEQYKEFQEQGLITEQNLNRFDATSPTWQHPHLTKEHLTKLLFECYHRFYSASHVLAQLFQMNLRKSKAFSTCLVATIFSRYAAYKGMHPMSGGVGQILLDKVEDYRQLRQELFGCNLVPLPKNLGLPPRDQRLNQIANPNLLTVS